MSLRGTLDVMTATVQRATSVPMTASCLVNRAEMLALVAQARAGVPLEIREAALLLAQRDDILGDGRREADLVVSEAERRAADLVDGSAIVTAARRRADEIVQAATAEAQRLMREADDYCDRRLAALEAELDRALTQVRGGRRRLADRANATGADILALIDSDMIDVTEGGKAGAGSRVSAAARHASARGPGRGARPERRVVDLTAAEAAAEAAEQAAAGQAERAGRGVGSAARTAGPATAPQGWSELGRGGDLQ